MEKHVRDWLVNYSLGLHLQKKNAVEIKEALIKQGLTQDMADQIEAAGRKDYRRMKRNAYGHMSSGSVLFIIGVLITWGSYSTSSGGFFVVTIGLLFGGLAELILGIWLRSKL